MQTLEKNSTQKILHFLLDWAAVIALVLCLVVFTALKGSFFMSKANMVNILLAMSITHRIRHRRHRHHGSGRL